MRLIETDSRAANSAAGTNASTPELKELVTEATRALARLDVARLEELALCCQALTRIPVPTTKKERGVFVDKARAARGEMAVFARVLEATRANLKVMERLRVIRAGGAEYLESSKGCGSFNLRDTEGGYGNN